MLVIYWWGTCHDVLCVNYYLYNNQSAKINPVLCGKIETIPHLFLECKIIAPFNRIVLYLLKRVTSSKINFSEAIFRFNLLPPLEENARYVSLILISES